MTPEEFEENTTNLIFLDKMEEDKRNFEKLYTLPKLNEEQKKLAKERTKNEKKPYVN